jgi:hypothetical protein
MKKFVDHYIYLSALILFFTEKDLKSDLSGEPSRVDSHLHFCSYNKKIVDECKKSLYRILEMRNTNTLTRAALQAERDFAIAKMEKLDKRNFAGRLAVALLRRLRAVLRNL